MLLVEMLFTFLSKLTLSKALSPSQPPNQQSTNLLAYRTFTMFGYFSGLKGRVVSAIMDDRETLHGCQVLAAQRQLPTDEVVDDFAQLIIIRINYHRKTTMTRLEQVWEGIYYSERKDLRAELGKISAKYGLSYQQATTVSDDVFKEFQGTIPTPGEQVWQFVKPFILGCVRYYLKIASEIPIVGRLLVPVLEVFDKKRITWES